MSNAVAQQRGNQKKQTNRRGGGVGRGMTREEVWNLIPDDRIITEEELETMTRLREEAEEYTEEK